MAWKPFAVVTVTNAGTPVQVTATRKPVHAVLIETYWTNSGRMYVGDSTLNVSTNTGLMNALPPPTTNVFPSVSAGIPSAPNGLNLSDLWIDAQNNGEKVIVSYLEN